MLSDNMTRSLKVGIRVANFMILVETIVVICNWNGSLGSIGAMLLFPTASVTYGLARFFPDSILVSETELQPWEDFLTAFALILISALVWGLIAFLLSRYCFDQNKALKDF